MTEPPAVGALSFNMVDVVAAILLVIGVWRGFRRGLSGELAKLISLVVMMVAGWQFYQPLSERLGGTRLSSEGAQLAAFLGTVIAAGLAMWLLWLVLRHLMEFKFKTPLEQIGGMAAGATRTLILFSIIVVCMALTPIPYFRRVFGEESLLGSVIMRDAVPVYRQVAEENPDLGLPTLDDLDAPLDNAPPPVQSDSGNPTSDSPAEEAERTP